MTTTSDVQMSVKLAFPKAEVVFAIKVEPPSGQSNGQGRSFHLAVTDTTGTRTTPFKADASPHLADWVRGYTRWLVRANVRASHDESSISGTFADGLTPEQVLLGVRDACDMIRQRFELYEESILA